MWGSKTIKQLPLFPELEQIPIEYRPNNRADYNAGKLDIIAQMFFHIRHHTLRQTLRALAEEHKENPHAKWFLAKTRL